MVTGGTKGIGAAVVATLREAGATLITGADYLVDGGTVPVA